MKPAVLSIFFFFSLAGPRNTSAGVSIVHLAGVHDGDYIVLSFYWLSNC